MNKIALTIILVAVAGTVQAQLGQDMDACQKMWGAPTNGPLDEQGNGLISYTFKGTGVELEYVDHKVWTACYTREAFSHADIDGLLHLNGAGSDWTVWTPPGVPASEVESNQWLRNDEAAMAQLDDGRLLVRGERVLPDSRPKNETAAAAQEGNSETPSVVEADSSPKPSKTISREVVGRPSKMPTLGDSMARVVQLLGDPKGIMESGGKQVMLYGWGSVWIASGKVVGIE